MKVSARGDPATVVDAAGVAVTDAAGVAVTDAAGVAVTDAAGVAVVDDPPPVVGDSSGPQAVSTAALASAPITAAVFFIRSSESTTHRADLGVLPNNADAP
ncbi:hypothetical protein [Nocardia pseudovaccinii]|uniref:hypothetical protein n=1 Tax=Nocardia pseudovaccinii TaxID=189540 RepID=UPI0007A3B669|nr:hypothetical protein [Nocardia pseudovaccinii]